MTPERIAGVVARWARIYTRSVPPPIADRRIGEIDADLHDHIAHERAHGTKDRRIALGIAVRMLRGVAADASWRGEMLARSSTPKEVMKMSGRSYLRVGLVTAAILLVPLLRMLFGDGTNWGVFDFVFAALLLGGTGLLIESALKRPRNLGFRIAAVVIAVAAMALGEADDAPGLVLFGCLLIAGTIALTFRTAQRSE